MKFYCLIVTIVVPIDFHFSMFLFQKHLLLLPILQRHKTNQVLPLFTIRQLWKGLLLLILTPLEDILEFSEIVQMHT